MKILITGTSGFIGTNLKEQIIKSTKNTLSNIEFYDFNSTNDPQYLKEMTVDCDIVYHLAAVHRPVNTLEFEAVNINLFDLLLQSLALNSNRCPIVLTSSVQALDDTPYGRSKIAAENILKEFSKTHGNKAIIYRLTNTFGAYAKPNAHSVVATFCYNISRSLPVLISSPEHVLQLYYIDDVCNSLISHLGENPDTPNNDGIYRLADALTYSLSLGRLSEIIQSFKNETFESNKELLVDRLYKTYLYYLN
jgi:UDP-2-acetamido-2,6-beta-L-arabino-hexul-4-ose reductase